LSDFPNGSYDHSITSSAMVPSSAPLIEGERAISSFGKDNVSFLPLDNVHNPPVAPHPS
jgi:hypothetical protein